MQAVVFAYNTTPHVSTGFNPLFLEHGRESMLPLFREVGEPCWESGSQSWLAHLWEAQWKTYEAHLLAVKRRQAIF